MPATSQSQQHLMGAAYAVKTGQQKLKDLPDGMRDKVKGMLRTMKESQLREFASTQTKGLPRHVGGSAGAKLRRVRSA